MRLTRRILKGVKSTYIEYPELPTEIGIHANRKNQYEDWHDQNNQ